MGNRFMRFCALQGALLSILLLVGCSHTVQGMRQDIREATDSDDQKKVVVVKKTTTVESQSSLPASPPPLQTPPQ